MIRNYLTLVPHFNRYAVVVISTAIFGLSPLHSQIKYVPADERKDAGMGVERVARFFTPVYESKLAKTDNEIRW
ncbi:MAG: hypothetical protein IQL11_06185, partial [Bacteroidales bacterium]|nr:hypothetical protein [Bacteroidales bacterium]